MVEEYEEIADPSERPEEQDDDMDYPPGYAPGDGDSNNLIGSAKDAIFNIVKDIAVVLGGSDEMPGNITSQEVNMTEPQLQPETTTETKPDIQPEPEVEDFSTTATQGTQTPEAAVNDLNSVPAATEEQIVIPLEKDEDEPSISSTIIYLGEEEVDEEKLDDQQNQDPCALLPLSPACSCTASLHEYLLQACLLHMPQNCTNCQNVEQIQMDIPNWVIYQPPSSYPHPQQPQKDSIEIPDKEDSVSENENKAENTLSANTISQPEVRPIEPSQISDHLNTIESSVTIATPVEEMPQLVQEIPIKIPNSKINQDSAEEKQIESTSTHSGSVNSVPTFSATLDDATPSKEKTNVDPSQEMESKDSKDAAPVVTSKTPHSGPDATVAPDEKLPEIEPIPDSLPPEVLSMDLKMEDTAEDIAAGISRPSAAITSSLSDIYAEPPNGTELNGSPVHGSSQKESVFMRLNNRIKALEMNMSLSGRYLEQLSQRYRKQMEEMQKAFNKTIIKLQNTSRVAEEQDLRQTESIQQLQGQLANVTRLVLNLSVQVSQLQSEVSDRESYLLLSLFMCLCLGLLLYINRCRMSSTSCPEPDPPIPESYTYCCPERQFSSDEAALKRSASYPLLHSDSFQLASTMDPEILQHEETQSLCPASKKRRRRKVKSLEKVETLKPSLHATENFQNKGPDKTCNGGSLLVEFNPLAQTILQPPFRDPVSEGSSEGSSHSDDPSFCGITAACNRICDGLPAKSRAERRALRRGRATNSAVVDYLKAPSRHKRNSLPIYTIHDIMERQEHSSCGLNVHLSGPV